MKNLIVRIVQRLTGSKLEISSLLEESPSIILQGQTIISPLVIAEHMISSQPAQSYLLGESAEEKTSVKRTADECLSVWKERFSTNQLEAITDANTLFSDRVFLATNYFTLADIAMYSVLYTVPLGGLDRLQIPNVIRYFDTIQNVIQNLAAIPELKLTQFELEVPLIVTVPEVKIKAAKVPADGQKDVKGQKEAKVKKVEVPAKGGAKEAATIDPSQLDVRVGKVLKVERHPDADGLYVESIDLGEALPRTVVSGLVRFMKESELENQFVLCLCNLKPAKMRGVESAAMILCATSLDGTKVEFLQPAQGSKVGDVATFDGYIGKAEPLLKPKAKIWEGIQAHLFTSAIREACFINPDDKKECRLKTDSGFVTVKTIAGGPIK